MSNEPTISVQVFIDTDTLISVDPGHTTGTGTWLNVRGDNSMTGIAVHMHSREDVERMRDLLSEWLGLGE